MTSNLTHQLHNPISVTDLRRHRRHRPPPSSTSAVIAVIAVTEQQSQSAHVYAIRVSISLLLFRTTITISLHFPCDSSKQTNKSINQFQTIIMSRLIQSRLLINNAIGRGRGRGRFYSTDSNKIDEPLKVEEAETVIQPPPLTEKLLVLGGNGFVGSHICKEALDRGFSVASLSRSGKSSIQEPWANKVSWHQGNLLSGDSWKEALDGVTSVISCVGGFGSNSQMYKINGTANINAVRAAADKGIKRFVYISASDFGVINYLLQGYYDGKRATETELLAKFPYGHVILRPGFIYGTRQVGSMKLPLGVIGSPLEMVMQYAKPLNQVPIIGPLLTPPVDVKAVAKVAVRGAIDPVFPPGIVDVHTLKRYSQQKAF